VARDDRGAREPGINRDRFLSEFALALVEGVPLKEFLDWSVAQIGRILDVDRVTLFLFGAGAADGALAVQASWAAEGVETVPATIPLSEAVVSAELRALEPVVLEDVASLLDQVEIAKTLRGFGTKSVLAVPIAIDGDLRGVVAAATVSRRRAWAPDDVSFLESAVHHLSAALKQTELVEELGRERDRLSVLFDLASAVQRSTTVNDVVETALSGLRDTLLFPIGVFALIAPEGDAVIRLGGYGGTEPEQFSGRVPLTPEHPTVSFRVLESGQPLIVNDIEQEPEGSSKESFRELGARSFGAFPMRSAGKTIGVMTVASRDTSSRIEEDDVETLQSLADFVGVALEQRRSADAVAAAMREARSLADASHTLLTRTADRRVLLDQILDVLAQHFGHEACSLLLVEQEPPVLVRIGRRGWSCSPVDVIPLDAAGLIPLAARTGRIVNAPDVAKASDYVEGWRDARSELAVPLILDDRVVGVFDLQSGCPNAFSDADARTISAFAERAALALRLSKLVDTLENRTRVLEAVTRATQLLNFRLHAPDVLTSIVEETTRTFPAADGSVAWVCDAEGSNLSVAAADGIGGMILHASGSAPRALEDLKCAGPAFLENRPVITQVSGFDELSAGWSPGARARALAGVEDADVHSLIAVPIRVGDHRLGVLEVLSLGRDAFTPEDGDTLTLLAEQSAIALRNARLVEELQRSNRMKDDFVANLSHEIRTPLTGIVGWAEVLLDSHRDDADAQLALGAILGQAETLSRMLADLIDLSRIDNFGLELRRGEVALPEILAAALDAVSPGARRKGVAIRCTFDPDLPSLKGDAARLTQVLWNLLANGVKFSPAGGTVHVVGRRVPGGGLEIAVEDEGHGIDPEFLKLVFERFRQEETSSNRRFGGLGIGLAIARAIVLAHGGTIVAESEGRERGSRFRVTFPADRVMARSQDAKREKLKAVR
jgi:signal transduction histidine kinase